MSSYAKLAREEQENVEDEILETKIEELNKLQYYDYYFSNFVNTIFWNRVECFGK